MFCFYMCTCAAMSMNLDIWAQHNHSYLFVIDEMIVVVYIWFFIIILLLQHDRPLFFMMMDITVLSL